MAQTSSPLKDLIFQGLFLVLSIAFFLSVGVVTPGHLQTRMILTGVWAAAFFVLFFRSFSMLKIKSFSFYFLAAVFIFEMVRALAAFLHFPGLEPQAVKMGVYYQSALIWGLYFFGFTVSYLYFNQKSALTLFLKTNSVLAFLLSLQIIPPLLQKGNPHTFHGPTFYLFNPLLYFQPWVEKYVLAYTTHPNRIGDFIAFGLFGSLGLLLYAFWQFKDRIKNAISYMEKPNAQEWSLFFLYVAVSLVTGVAIILLFSRGTITCVTFVFLASFLFIAFKFPSKTQWFFLLAIVTVGVLFFSSVANLQKTWKELQTLQSEKQALKEDLNQTAQKSRSIFMTQEGMKRSLKIFKRYPLWGAGTDGYKYIAKNYASEGEYGQLRLANDTAMCFYVQILSEEGIGAFLYYAFLTFFLMELVTGLFRTQSQFKFLAALCLAAPAVTIFIHASFNEILQRFTAAMPVYILMGASLAALRKDFQHDA